MKLKTFFYRLREREREINVSYLKKIKTVIWKIRTGNPSLAVKSLEIPLDQSFQER